MDTEPLDDDYRMPLNPKPRYCSQCDNEVGEDETLCQGCQEDAAPTDMTPTPRTDKAAYYMGRKGPDRDTERWCDLLNESRAIERDLAAAVAAINNCVDWANGREHEWGDRAENAFNFLHSFLATRTP